VGIGIIMGPPSNFADNESTVTRNSEIDLWRLCNTHAVECLHHTGGSNTKQELPAAALTRKKSNGTI